MRRRSYSKTFLNRRRSSGAARLITGVIVMGLLVVVAAGIWLAQFAVTPVTRPSESRYFDLERGVSVGKLARQLEQSGIISDADSFVILVRVLGHSGSLKAGSYQTEESVTPWQLVSKLKRGEFAQGQIRFIEGWTFRQLRDVLDEHPALTHQTSDWTGLEILQEIGAKETHPEGLFFPDTYYFSAGTSDLTILRNAYNMMQSILNDAWENRASDLPVKTRYEALILASIVEKETGAADERKLVAAVFVNRLRKVMRLQTDPTVIYGLGEKFDGNLRKRDLLADTPYNSYTRYGLPPTPIALPGKAAIEATLQPADSRALYFVSKGNGTHHFSNNLREHNEAVNRYQR